MNARRILVGGAVAAVLAGCGAAQGPSEETSSTDEALFDVPICPPLPAAQWWDGSKDTNANDAWISTGQRWTDPATGNEYGAWIALDTSTQRVTQTRWVADANVGYLACVDLACYIQPTGGINGQAPIQNPGGGGTRILVPPSLQPCPTCAWQPVAPPAVSCVTLDQLHQWWLDLEDDPTTGSVARCSNPAWCTPTTSTSTVASGVGSGGTGIHTGGNVHHPM